MHSRNCTGHLSPNWHRSASSKRILFQPSHEYCGARKISRPSNARPLPAIELDEIKYEQKASHNPYVVEALENDRAAQAQARKELGDTFDLIEVGKKTTFDGLMEDLTVEERLDAIVDKSLKRLLMLKGVKSLNGSSQIATPPTNPKMIQSA